MSSIKVLVVDDSLTFRAILLSVLEKFKVIEQTRQAKDGIEALNILETYEPDLVLLDIEMPRLSGLPTLRIAKRRYPHIEFLIVSGATRGAAELTVQAIDAGAIDFIVKPKATVQSSGAETMERRLSPFIRYIAARPPSLLKLKKKKALNWSDSLVETTPGISSSSIKDILKKSKTIKDPEKIVDPDLNIDSRASHRAETTRYNGFFTANEEQDSGLKGSHYQKLVNTYTKHSDKFRLKLVVIGASTGSPGVLTSIISNMPPHFPAPIVVIVHLPDTFAISFARHLAAKSKISVSLASDNQVMLPGTVYVARADKHLTVAFDPNIALGHIPYKFVYDDSPPVNGIRPSIDKMFFSLAHSGVTGCLGIIMTGMGKDGTAGISELSQLPGNYFIAQSPDTCVVSSMPQSLINSNLANEIVDLDDLSSAIISKGQNL